MASSPPRGGAGDLDSHILPRINVFGTPLLPAPVPPGGPTTGFFRQNYCDASPLDPASHTVAAVVTPEFLDFSASHGNDLRPLFPSLRSPSSSQQPCVWCLCAARWAEALFHHRERALPASIVPRVVLEATHEQALVDSGVDLGEMEKWAVGGDGTGRVPGGGGEGGATGEGGRARGARETVGR
ncbi:hypothetical protein JCM1840_005940 [Sporobolomyces johnsonii]